MSVDQNQCPKCQNQQGAKNAGVNLDSYTTVVTELSVRDTDGQIQCQFFESPPYKCIIWILLIIFKNKV